MKYDWYQTPHSIIIEVYFKGACNDDVRVVIDSEQLIVEIKDDKFELRLYAPCSTPSYSITPLKVVLELQKLCAEPWKSLERTDDNNSAHPVRSKWSDINVEEDDGDEREKQDVNEFFKKIYQQGDENTRRAMRKSMEESGGTVLSTNWSDVGSRKVERKQ